MEQNVAGGQNRDEKQPAGSQPIKQDARYPTPEFMRLLVELGKIVERQERSKDLPDDVAHPNLPSKD